MTDKDGDSPEREGRAAEIREEIREDVLVVADAVAGRVRADAGRVRRAVRLLSHGMVAGVLAIHLLATATLSWIVLSHPVPHPEMYPVMGLVLLLVLSTRFTALLGGRTSAAARGLIVNFLLHAFWMWILVDQVPARMIVGDRVVERTPLLWLAVPIFLYLLALGGTVAQGIVWRRHQRLAAEALGED
jgi:hypothetical protein